MARDDSDGFAQLKAARISKLMNWFLIDLRHLFWFMASITRVRAKWKFLMLGSI